MESPAYIWQYALPPLMVTPTPILSHLGSIMAWKWRGELTQLATAYRAMLAEAEPLNTVRLLANP